MSTSPYRGKIYLMSIWNVQQVGSVGFERQPIADHAQNLASTIQSNLRKSLEAIGVVCLFLSMPLQTLSSPRHLHNNSKEEGLLPIIVLPQSLLETAPQQSHCLNTQFLVINL